MHAINARPISQRTIHDKTLNFRCTSIIAHQQHTEHSIIMHHAMAAVDKGDSIRLASQKFGIPRSTLHDRVSGKVKMMVGVALLTT